MSEIPYKSFEAYLKKGKFSPVYLIYGEELLCKNALDALLNALIPASERNVNYEPVDNDNIYEAIERVNTFSLLPGTKAVALCDSRIFYSKQDDSSILEKAKAAYDEKEIKKAAKYFAGLLGVLNLSFEDVSNKEKREKNLKSDSELLNDDKWLEEIVAFCTENSVPVLAAKDHAGDLQNAVERGFPESNHLIVTTDIADKRRNLFKAIDTHGIIVDCSVAKGNRMADKKEQDTVLAEQMKEILGQSGKTMARDAYPALYEMTGFDLRNFSNNLEKLVIYVGDRKNITLDDVNAILKRTKQDPIYELTNAVSERNTEDALFFMDSLLSSGIFPLQILGAVTNQIRKVLLIKGFTETPPGKAWNPKMQYSQFQNKVLPALEAYDVQLLTCLEAWENLLSEEESGDADQEKKKGKKKKNKAATDLLTAAGNPYPLFLMLQKSEKFSKSDLLEAIQSLSEADLQLKTSGRNPRLVLEKVILHICRSARPV